MEHRRGPALVLAGPGSGKTTVITARVAYLCLACGVPPYRILSITYSRASARDMAERFNHIYGDEIDGKVRFSTIHSFCNRVILDYEKRQGQSFTRFEGITGPEGKRAVLAGIYQKINQQHIGEDEMETLQTAIGLVKNKMLPDAGQLDCDIENFAEIYKAFEAYKRERLLIDFDDMLVYAYQIFRKCPDLLEKYRRWYAYVQVDEAQDASKIQFEIIWQLVGRRQNLFVVADDDQSIYGFRGAAPAEILSIQKTYPGCEIFKLEKNYRSTENIVEISSRLIRANTARYDKQHTTDNAKAADPILMRCDDEYNQWVYVLGQVQKSLQERPESTMAILYRNNLSAINMVDILDRNGVPFKLREARVFFFTHWVVLDVIAILRFALDQSDAEAFMRFYYKIHRYLSKPLAEYATERASGAGEAVLDAAAEFPGLKAFQQKKICELKEQLAAVAGMTAGNALRYIEEGFQYLEYVKEHASITKSSPEYATGIFGILKEIARFCRSVPEFLERIGELDRMFNGAPRKREEETVLTLSTLHSSKGLEFDTVFMIDLTSQEIPGNRIAEHPVEERDALEEERRLYYVGMTRARYNVYMLCPITLRGIPQWPSLFMEETARCMEKQQKDGVKEPMEASRRPDAVNGEYSGTPGASAAVSIGQTVAHKVFGKGIVTEVKHFNGYTTVYVNFGGKVKTLDWELCQRTGLAS